MRKLLKFMLCIAFLIIIIILCVDLQPNEYGDPTRMRFVAPRLPTRPDLSKCLQNTKTGN